MILCRSRAATHSTHKVTLYAAMIAVIFITGIYLMSHTSDGSDGIVIDSTGTREASLRTALNQELPATSSSGGSAPENEEAPDEEESDPTKIAQGSVVYGEKTLSYYHCGPLPSSDGPDLTELVLLHGASFTKEDWKSSGILDMLSERNNAEDGMNLSISALDLPKTADGEELVAAFDALTSNKILSGRAVTLVSPSASGKAIVSLAEMAENGSNELSRIIKAWIPVAPGAVVSASESTLLQYKSASISIMAIHGDQDAMGKKVTQRLVDLNGAKGIELEGRHPVYLDSPNEFVHEVMQFLETEVL